MQRLSRSLTATPLGTVPDTPPAAFDSDWAQGELTSYFKQHPEKLSFQLDRIMDKLRQSQGDMQGFIVELDTLIDQLNADIDQERREVVGRGRLMRDYPDVTNEFLHFFLDGIMEAMEQEQAAGVGGGVNTRSSSGSAASVVGRSSGLLSGGLPGAGLRQRPASSGSAGGKERFSSVPRRMPS